MLNEQLEPYCKVGPIKSLLVLSILNIDWIPPGSHQVPALWIRTVDAHGSSCPQLNGPQCW